MTNDKTFPTHNNRQLSNFVPSICFVTKYIRFPSIAQTHLHNRLDLCGVDGWNLTLVHFNARPRPSRNSPPKWDSRDEWGIYFFPYLRTIKCDIDGLGDSPEKCDESALPLDTFHSMQ